MSINEILALVIAGLAFVFSLISFVYTVLTGPRIKLLFGGEILLAYTAERELYILSGFVFFNQGAQPGAIVELAGTLSRVDSGEKIPLRWADFYENKFVEEKGEFWYIPQGKPHTLVVSGRGVGGTETQSIGLQTRKLAETGLLQDGHYKLELMGLVGPGLRVWCKARATLYITEGHSSYLAQYCKPGKNGNILNYLYCRRDNESRESFVSSGSNVPKAPEATPSKPQN
jgi:hypothetical protein